MKAFATAITMSVASALDELKYINYLAKFGKEINSVEEFATRLVHFSTLDEHIEEHNAGNHNYTLGHNQFSDWSREEYKAILGYKPELEPTAKTFTTFDESNNNMEVDWRAAGAVTPVKD